MASDNEAFEAWANTHGGLDLTMHEAMDNEKLPFPCTYYNYTTEIAWRAFANKKEPAQASQAQQPVSSDYTVLIGRLAYALKKANPDSDLPLKATEFLQRKGHTFNPLRDHSQSQQPSEEFKTAALQELYNFQEATGCDVAAELKPHQLSQAQQNESQWISVEERLPENEGIYLCVLDSDDGLFVESLEFNKKQEWIFQGEPTFCKSYYVNVTHWMPLPLPPAPEGEKT